MVEKNNRDNPTRRRILRVARRLFADAGYDGVSVGELARAARVNRAMLYYYFKDKRDPVSYTHLTLPTNREV